MLDSLIVLFVNKVILAYPALSMVLWFLAIARIINKPLFSMLHRIVDLTPTEEDNLWVKKIEESKVLSTFFYLCDYLFSLKILPQVKSVEEKKEEQVK